MLSSDSSSTPARDLSSSAAESAELLRFRRFGAALEAVRKDAASQVGPADLRRVQRLNFSSRVFEVAGRLLIHFSFEPLLFCLGVILLWLRKQLHMTEIGHVALHGTYDHIGGGKTFSAKTFKWDCPIDEASWRYGHNIRHHSATNVAGRDAEIHFGPVRLSYNTAFHPVYRYQMLQFVVLIVPGFLFWMGAHFAGIIDLICGNCRPERFDFLPDRSWASVKTALRRSCRKWVPFYFKNYVFFPALAGPFFWKVLLGNFLADVLCNIYSALGIMCSHNGARIKMFPTGTKPRSHGEWCAMQIEATNNFKVAYPFSVLLGALDYQIEHHLFPTLPPEKLRQIAPQVRAICAEYGVEYRCESWGRSIREVFQQVQTMSRPGGSLEVYPALGWTDPAW